MDIDPVELGTLGSAERSKFASEKAGLKFGEMLPTGVVDKDEYDFYFDETAPGPEVKDPFPGSKRQKYMDAYTKKYKYS
jgi:hypothetical protein